ncbi:MAG: IS1380 family transposase [Terriglobales bacterium]
MRYSPRNIKVACDHEGLTHVGGIHFFHEFVRVLQLRNFLATHLTYPRRNNRYHLSQMILALLYPMVLGLDRLETASFLRSNGTFQYLTGLPSFPDPQTLRRFLLQAPDGFWQQIHRVNDRLLQHFIHQPEHRSRLIFDLDSTVVTVFGHQDGAEIGYNPRYRGKRSYNPLLCIEANSSYLWDTELRPGNAGTWDGSLQLLDTCFANTPPDIREIRVRADAGFGFNPVFETLESRPTQYAVVARLTQALRRLLPGLRYQSANRDWEIAEFEHLPARLAQGSSFRGGATIHPTRGSRDYSVRHGTLHYRAWVTTLSLTPIGIWHFYDGRAGMEPRIRELREDFAMRKIPTASFAANALFLEIVRLAYNLVTAFQRTCLDESWQALTLPKLRYKLFMLPGELTRPQNRPVLRLRPSPLIDGLPEKILAKVSKLRPLES